MALGITAHELGIGYRDRVLATHIELHVQRGHIVCLLGPNGCGKTTLFKTLMGLLPARAGTVEIDGAALNHLSPEEIARRIAYVPQTQGPVFPYTVEEIVLMGRTAQVGLFSAPSSSDREIARDALAQMHIEQLSHQTFSTLSGGQRQLVLIARALAQQAPYVVLDEPTASLDFGNQMKVLEQVRQLADASLGLIISTHNPDHAFAVADQVILFGEAGISDAKPPAQQLTGERLTALYDHPIDVVTLADGRQVCVSRPRPDAQSRR